MGQERLPTWAECEAVCDKENITALEWFIYHHETRSFDNPEIWREGLVELLDEAKRDLAQKVLDAVGNFRGQDVRKVDVITVLRRVFIDSGIELTTTQQQEGNSR
jgi:hypothetical protein